MDFISNIIPEQGIIDYITDYQEENDPSEIFKFLIKNLSIKRKVFKKEILYKLKWELKEVIIRGPYNFLINKLEKYQLLYDFLYMWMIVKKAESADEFDDISFKVFIFFEDLFDNEIGLVEDEKEFLIDKVNMYYF